MPKKIILSLAILSIALPYLALAQRASGIPFWGSPLVSCTGFQPDAQGNIPKDASGKPLSSAVTCTSFCDLLDTGINIIYFIMTIGLFVLLPIFFAWGGIMILISGANPGARETGKKMLTGAAIGAVIILLSFVIIKTVVDFIEVKLPGINEPLTCDRTTP